MQVDIQKARRFAGLTDDSQDALLELCAQAAIEWYERAGVATREDDALYTFWVYNLAAWFFDARGYAGEDAKLPLGIVSSVHQLRAGNPIQTGGDGA